MSEDEDSQLISEAMDTAKLRDRRRTIEQPVPENDISGSRPSIRNLKPSPYSSHKIL